ncbi:Furin-like protease 2 [Fragariocoptes setiger]|uniref:Furin-like protease 2 n=1 Tax=Fragariocoptes setiger TaxID=1670756 RepID=A0ABQ7SCP4_9ACAR|nr:Furin-like protease 2 [Fragariocoptes setiger]
MVMKYSKTYSYFVVFMVVCLHEFIISHHGHASNTTQLDYRRYESKVYTNHIAVELAPGADADQVAKDSGLINLGKIGTLENYYLFTGHHISKRSLEQAHSPTLDEHEHVLWFEQQHVKIRSKRDLSYPLQPLSSPVPTPGSIFKFSDPLYDKQWYFHGGARGGYDMNVIPVWKMGYTGRGVVLTILDDGVQSNHPDLIKNYDHQASYDINDRDDNPTPQDNGENKHGTRCAGEIAAEAGNEYCGVGIAYNARIGGVRMLDGTVTDEVEATALSLKPSHIDVYSASWGPDDNGKTVDGPGRLAAQAFINGIKNGRKGKGSIYVWASGNGGRKSDNCNCDGYTNSIYTLSISSATQRGQKPWYLEECSSTLATTYSSGTPSKDENIVTVDQNTEYFKALEEGKKPNVNKLCTQVHTGTSASAPIAAGIVALVLEANPDLTWRDMQHIVVMTSRSKPLEHESGWVTNGMNRNVSHKFGYGLMDAEAMVKMALRWRPLPPQVVCKTNSDNRELQIQKDLVVTMKTDACARTVNEVNYLEHVQARITLKFQPRGNLRITLISPSGTPSHLLMPRPRDTEEDTFDKWPFMSVHFWGERANGTWKLIIRNEDRRKIPEQQGHLFSWSLVFFGTTSAPINVTQNHNLNMRRADETLLGSGLPESYLKDNAEVVNLPTATQPKIGSLPESLANSLNFSSEKPWMIPVSIIFGIFIVTVIMFTVMFTAVRLGSRAIQRIGLYNVLSRCRNSEQSPSTSSSDTVEYSRVPTAEC